MHSTVDIKTAVGDVPAVLQRQQRDEAKSFSRCFAFAIGIEDIGDSDARADYAQCCRLSSTTATMHRPKHRSPTPPRKESRDEKRAKRVLTRRNERKPEEKRSIEGLLMEAKRILKRAFYNCRTHPTDQSRPISVQSNG